MKAGLLFFTALTIVTTALAAPPAKPPTTRPPPVGPGRPRRPRQISPGCDLTGLDNVTVPVANPALPAPASDNFLASIVIGRGVQNYTCGNDSSAAPVANGAIAILYEASCIGMSDPDLLAALPQQALAVPLPADPEADLMCGRQRLERSGHHFFNAAKTPTFDFTETDDPELGLGLVTVGQRSPAPDPAAAVPWLSLVRTDGSVGPIQAIYRLTTAGGVAPATCAGQPKDISVQYAAQYWVYSKDA